MANGDLELSKQMERTFKAEEKLIKAGVTSNKARLKRFESLAKKKNVSRRILKGSKTTVVISQPVDMETKASHFFSKEMEATRRSMFFK